MRPTAMKVGELAKRTGVSVRTLHYYDEMGLLSPSQRSEAGYRLYSAEDIARLQQMKSLRQLGFRLEEIREWLNRPGCSPQEVIELHLHRLREQIALQRRLCERLETLASGLRLAEAEISVEEFIEAIEVMNMVEKYYTPEQLAWLKERADQIGQERIREVEAEWPRLMAEVRAEMEKGTDPGSERVRSLAKRWMGLIREFTGGNPEIEQAARSWWDSEESIQATMPVISGRWPVTSFPPAPIRELGITGLNPRGV